MKFAYPIVLTPAETGYSVYVPDLDINTEGDSLADALQWHPTPSACGELPSRIWAAKSPRRLKPCPHAKAEKLPPMRWWTSTPYRRANDMRTVRKNVTLQSWLNDMAEKAGVNFSQVLQEALKQRLGVTDR